MTARQARHAGEATTSAESILTFNSHESNNAFLVRCFLEMNQYMACIDSFLSLMILSLASIMIHDSQYLRINSALAAMCAEAVGCLQ